MELFMLVVELQVNTVIKPQGQLDLVVVDVDTILNLML
jgi:hypothetical protein